MDHLDRLKPAVLQLNPPTDSEGKKPLKNEYENRLYYFLQVSEDDFAQNVSLTSCSVQRYCTMTLKQFSPTQAQDDSGLATPLGEPESSMKVSILLYYV